MPLPSVNLDDRRFDDLVAQARQLIPQYCPEWTDHNTSDPGMALIEIFAWMTDLMLFRINQVPTKVLTQFLDMIGVQLQPPSAAVAPVTFYLSTTPTQPLNLPLATEVATVRTELSEAIVFSTEEDLNIYPAELNAIFTGNALGENTFVQHDLERLGVLGHKIPMFSPEPVAGDAFYLCFGQNLSQHVISLIMQCEVAGGAGVNPHEPPFVWEVWQGNLSRWMTCTVEFDGTMAFNVSGEVILRLPGLEEEEFFGEIGYWLRCRLTSEQNYSGYRVSPDLESLRTESRGGTVNARHAMVVRNEILGRSSGEPGQQFQLMNFPVLHLNTDEAVLVSEQPDGKQVAWTPVSDFAGSGPEDHHFQMDYLTGAITFGPALLQPDGTIYRFGAVPPKDSALKFIRYMYGGGVQGNVPAQALSVIKASIPYIARVTNHLPAVGGRNGQTLDDAMLRIPHVLRTRTRAVTADDFEFLAREVPGVARAHCLTPNASLAAGEISFPGQIRALDVQPGQISMVILPRADVKPGRLPPDQLVLSAELRSAVTAYLDERRLVGTVLEVRSPQYFWVSIGALLRVPSSTSPGARGDIQKEAELLLYRYLNPYIGGSEGHGWRFGRSLYVSELFSLLRTLSGVDFVEDVQIFISDPANPEQREPAGAHLLLPPQGLIVSDVHMVQVQ